MRLLSSRSGAALGSGSPVLGALGMLGMLGALACVSQGAPAPRVLARGVLPYGVAAVGDAIVTVELSERFELVVRDGLRERRLELGPPEQDLRALAVSGERAFVGSDAGFIREIDLTAMRVLRSFAVGAPLRALAADARYLLSADASGAVCLRRRDDGALLQCARADEPGGEPVSELAIAGETAWLSWQAHAQAPAAEATAAARANQPTAAAEVPAPRQIAWALPSLRPLTDIEVASTPSAQRGADRFRDGAVYPRGHQVIWQRGGERHVLAELATDVRFIALTASGSLIVAAWPTSLDDAVLLLIRR